MRVRLKPGTIIKILDAGGAVTRALAEIDEETQRVINYDSLTGSVSPGDEVIINTTATDLKLGTGGDGFIVINKSNPELNIEDEGHIMKLRYTPWQFAVQTVEEPQSPHHKLLTDFKKLKEMPVVVGGLHSQLFAAVAAIKHVKPNANIAYIMTDGAALPASYSKTARELKEKGLIKAIITIGQAFGGDLEAINIYSGLQAAKEVVEADIAVAIMGPGIVGTASDLGHTGLEQGQIINAVFSLGGRAVAIPRLSFADQRERHYGISHHTISALGIAALAKATIAIPVLTGEKRQIVLGQLNKAGLLEKHEVEEFSADEMVTELVKADNGMTTMGRGLTEDPDFFMAASAAGICAARMLDKND